MKRAIRYLLLSLLLVVVGVEVHAAAYTVGEIPHVQLADRTRYTANPDGILSEDAVRTIDFVCDTLRTGGYAEVAVVAVREIASDDVFSFAIDLFSEWGVGRAEGDNGLGILLVEGVHEIRFVTGDGLEGVLPDAICKRIQLQYMLPHFREGDYSAGMVARRGGRGACPGGIGTAPCGGGREPRNVAYAPLLPLPLYRLVALGVAS